MSAKKRVENDSPPKPGEYGVVVATKGRHVGRVGLYDNDETRGLAAVYFEGEPFKTDYVFVKLTSLRPATPEEELEWRENFGNEEELAQKMRTPPREPVVPPITGRTRRDGPGPRGRPRKSARSR